jgi:hypothetical protein
MVKKGKQTNPCDVYIDAEPVGVKPGRRAPKPFFDRSRQVAQ